METLVALVDDHHLMRAGLAATVNGLGGYRVLLEAGNGRELIAALQDLPPDGPITPRIAIVDLSMPVMDGYETIAWLRQHHPRMLALALTFDASDDALVRAIHAGARGFLSKSARPSVLKTALDSLMLTGYYHTDESTEAHLRSGEEKGRLDMERERAGERITPRELEFLTLVCDGSELTYDEIAERMGIHRRTVDNYRMQLFDKFGVKSKTGLVLYAVRWGLVDPK